MESYAAVESAENALFIARLEAEGHSVLRVPAVEWNGGFALSEVAGGTGCVFFLDSCSARRVLEHGSDAVSLENVLVGAADTSVVEVLREFGIHGDVVPMRLVATEVFKALGDFQSGETLGRLLFIGGSGAMGQSLLDEFAAGDHDWVDEVVIQSSWSSGPRDARTLALLEGGAADEAVIAHAVDVISLEELLGATVETLAVRFGFRAASKEAARMLAERGVIARLL